MALTRVQHIEGNSATNTTSVSATYASATTSGNILWYACAGDKNAGTWTAPSGFTTLFNLTAASVSLLVGYKVASGSETTITVSRSNASAAGDRLWISEYSSNLSGTWTIVGSASNNSDDTTVTSWSTGTTGSTTALGGALAFIAKDSWSTGNGTPSYTNSFSEIHTFGSGGRGCVSVAFKDGIASGSTVETTQSQASGPDQTSGAIAVFEKVSSTQTAAATRTGTGSSTAAVTGVRPGAATRTGAGSLSAAAAGVKPGGAARTGTASASATATVVKAVTATRTGTATATTTGDVTTGGTTHSASATRTGTGVVSTGAALAARVFAIGDASGNSTTGNSRTIDYPDGVTAGMVLYAYLAGSSATGLVNTPTGWTELRNTATSGGVSPSLWVGRKVADGTESGSLTVTSSGNAVMQGRMIAITRADTSTPEDVALSVYDNGTSTSPWDITGVTTTLNGTVLLVFAAANSTTITFTEPTSFTEYDDTTIRSGHASYRQWASKGATGTTTVTLSANSRGQAVLIAVRPATVTVASGSAARTGTGSATSTAASAKPVGVSRAGTGTITAGATVIRSVGASRTGVASAAATDSATKPVAGARTGTGALAASTAATKPTTATRTGTAAAAATGATIKAVAATLAGTGTRTATANIGSVTHEGAAARTGTGTITSAGATSKPVTASRTGTGSITAGATVIRSATATVTGTATITATGTVGAAPVTIAATATATITATGASTKVASATAALAATATRSAAATVTRFATAIGLTGTATATAGATVIKAATATRPGTATITVAGTVFEGGIQRDLTLTATLLRNPWTGSLLENGWTGKLQRNAWRATIKEDSMRAGRLSEVNVRIQITEDTGLDLTGNAVSIAIVPAGTVPTVDDLTAATFDGTIAYVLDGPRDAGIYDVHYRLTDNPERPFEFAGTHVRY